MADPSHVEILKRGAEEWNRWRRENPTITPHLAGSLMKSALRRFPGESAPYQDDLDLSGIDLSGANLNDSNLSFADFSNAKLRKASFRHSTLLGTIMSGANLWGANFFYANADGADLVSADLGQAELRHVDLTDADLSGADLSYAYMGHTILEGVNLTSAKGLESIIHDKPSIIGLNTFYVTEGDIPVAFLRGCGVPEDFITYLPSLTLKPIRFFSGFISYSHADKAFARRLYGALMAKGIRCFLDEHQILPGQDIHEEVDRGIKLWDKVLLCCSKDSLTSWWVDSELTKAFEKEQVLMRQRGAKVLALIPLDLDGHLFSGECKNAKASEIRSRMVADFTCWETDDRKFEEQVERLIRALRTDGGREPAPPRKL